MNTVCDAQSNGRLSKLIEPLRFAIPIAWRASSRSCLLLVVTSLLAAQAAPFVVLLTGAAVNEIQNALKAESSDASRIEFWLLIGAALGATVAVAVSIRKFSRQRLRDEIELRVNLDVLTHAASLDLETREDVETQNCLGRASQRPGFIVLNAIVGAVNAASALIQCAGLLLVLLWIEPVWSGLLGALAVPNLVAHWLLSRNRYLLHRRRTASIRRSNYYRGLLINHRFCSAIHTLRLAPWLLQRFELANDTILRTSRRIYAREAVVTLVSGITTVAAVAAVLMVVGHAALLGELSTGEFVAFWIAAWRLQAGFTRLGASFSEVFGAHFDIQNLRELMNIRAKTVDTRSLKKQLTGRISGHKLTYRYPGATRPAVDEVDLEIQPGETIALVGPNGAGKSTLARLLSNLYTPSDGQVKLDGVPVQDLEEECLYRQLAYLPQDVFPLEATAYENIAIGDIRDNADQRDDVYRIAKETGIDGFVSRLPQGYETPLGRTFGQSTLSGGQWRQLAVARSFVSNPALVILDEPFSNLDPSAEEQLLLTLESLLSSRTAILISHRFSMLRAVDRILVMDEGKIVEQGTHEELIRMAGLYASLYRSSTSRYQLDLPLDTGKAA